LPQLTKLKRLDIDTSSLGSPPLLDLCAKLENLQELRLWGDTADGSLLDLSHLIGLRDLQCLKLIGAGAKNVASLASLKHLRDLAFVLKDPAHELAKVTQLTRLMGNEQRAGLNGGQRQA
jgi:hypothetical protein